MKSSSKYPRYFYYFKIISELREEISTFPLPFALCPLPFALFPFPFALNFIFPASCDIFFPTHRI